MDESSPAYLKIIDYVEHNPAAVISTVGAEGKLHAAVVYVVPASHQTICFVTKNQTQKLQNLLSHPEVYMTIFNERESSTLQASGQAAISSDAQMIDYILNKITKIHSMQADWLPPVEKLQGGEYVVVGVKLEKARLAEYRTLDINEQVRFTEL